MTRTGQRSPTPRRREEGATIVVFALVLAVLLGFSALAVDLSSFYQDARAQQTDADLSCLAGVRHLPEDRTRALDVAAEFVRANIAEFRDEPTSPTDGGVWTAGDWAVRIETRVDDEPTKMRVTVWQDVPTSFGRILGIDDVEVSQMATCQALEARFRDLPFAVLPGPGADLGGILSPDGCGENQGNCQLLDVDRNDRWAGGTNDNLRANIAYGVDRRLVTYAESQMNCNASGTTSGSTCGAVWTKTGETTAAVNQGFLGRHNRPDFVGLLRNAVHYPERQLTVGHRRANADYWNHTLLPSQAWGSGGDWTQADEPVVVTGFLRSDTPRLARIPVVTCIQPHHNHCPTNGSGWGTGTSEMKILDFKYIFIQAPNELAHFTNVNQNDAGIVMVRATEIVFADGLIGGPDGGDLTPFSEGVKVLRLVAND